MTDISIYRQKLHVSDYWPQKEVEQTLRAFCQYLMATGPLKLTDTDVLQLKYSLADQRFVSTKPTWFICNAVGSIGHPDGRLSAPVPSVNLSGRILSLWEYDRLVLAAESPDFFRNFCKSYTTKGRGVFRRVQDGGNVQTNGELYYASE